MDHRHHRASRDVPVIFVEVPVGGSPAPLHRGKPPRYPSAQRQLWRPADKPPRLRRLLEEFRRQDEIVREMMTPSPAGLRAWLRGAA
jgi:hypothetical protein